MLIAEGEIELFAEEDPISKEPADDLKVHVNINGYLMTTKLTGSDRGIEVGASCGVLVEFPYGELFRSQLQPGSHFDVQAAGRVIGRLVLDDILEVREEHTYDPDQDELRTLEPGEEVVESPYATENDDD